MIDDTTTPTIDITPTTVPAVADNNNAEVEDDGLELDPADLPDGALPEDGEEVEIEYEGKKHKVSKELKDAFLRQADYTRKTQDVAEKRREVEAAYQAAQQIRQMNEQDLVDVGQIINLDKQIQQYKALTREQWQQIEQADPAKAGQLWRDYQFLQTQREDLAKGVQERRQQVQAEEQRSAAKALEENRTTLKKLIPNWSPELGKQVADFGIKEIGLTAQEAATISDPRHVQALYLAMIGAKVLAKSRAQSKPVEVEANPVPQVAARRPAPTTDLAKIQDPKEWLRVRNQQLARNNRANRR